MAQNQSEEVLKRIYGDLEIPGDERELKILHKWTQEIIQGKGPGTPLLRDQAPYTDLETVSTSKKELYVN